MGVVTRGVERTELEVCPIPHQLRQSVRTSPVSSSGGVSPVGLAVYSGFYALVGTSAIDRKLSSFHLCWRFAINLISEKSNEFSDSIHRRASNLLSMSHRPHTVGVVLRSSRGNIIAHTHAVNQDWRAANSCSSRCVQC